MKSNIAYDLLQLIGGKENIRAMEHCATRLRLVLVDPQIAVDNGDLIDAVEGVKGHFLSVGQFQIILGTGLVNTVHDEMLKLDIVTNDNVKAEIYKDLSLLQKASRIMGDIFIPIIPAIVAAGMFMGLMNTFKFAGLVQADSDFALFMGILTETAFIFLPALICWSATKKFGGNPVLGIVVGLMLVSPALPNAWAAAGGLGDVNPLVFDLFGLKINVVGAQGQVLTPLILGLILARLEHFFRKYCPESLDIIIVPMFSIACSLIVGLFFIGPILFALEHMIASFVYNLLLLPLGIGQLVFAFLNPIFVMSGLHHAFGPLEIAFIAEFGGNPLNVAIACANVAMAGAAVGCALKIKNNKTKSLGFSSAITAGFGITEPALFGVVLRTPRVLLLSMSGGAIGAWFGGFMQIQALGTGVTGIPGILLYIGTGQTVFYVTSILIAFVSALLLTYKFGKF